jgi:hypothetical protein
LALLFPLAACAADFDRAEYTRFEPVSPTEFRVDIQADHFNPVDDPDREAQRLGWIKALLSDNHMCPRGHRITDRTVINAGKNMGWTVYSIAYRGQCTA